MKFQAITEKEFEARDVPNAKRLAKVVACDLRALRPGRFEKSCRGLAIECRLQESKMKLKLYSILTSIRPLIHLSCFSRGANMAWKIFKKRVFESPFTAIHLGCLHGTKHHVHSRLQASLSSSSNIRSASSPLQICSRTRSLHSKEMIWFLYRFMRWFTSASIQPSSCRMG